MALTYVVPAPGETTGSILNERGGLEAHVYANDPLGRKMAAAPELVDLVREIVLWVGATAELLATVPLPQGGHSRTLIDAIEGGRAWARDGSKAKAALKKAGVEP